MKQYTARHNQDLWKPKRSATATPIQTAQSEPIKNSAQQACPCEGMCPRCQGVQTKFKADGKNDRFEQEADRMSEHPEQIHSLWGSLDSVTIHSGSQAAAMAEAMHARAFTTGNHIYFNQGEYQPKTVQGQKLLAHEMTHVQQQKQFATPPVQCKKSAGEHAGSTTTATAQNMMETFHPSDIKMTDIVPWVEGTKIYLDFMLERFEGEVIAHNPANDYVVIQTSIPIVLDLLLSQQGEAQGVNARALIELTDLLDFPITGSEEGLELATIGYDALNQIFITPTGMSNFNIYMRPRGQAIELVADFGTSFNAVIGSISPHADAVYLEQHDPGDFLMDENMEIQSINELLTFFPDFYLHVNKDLQVELSPEARDALGYFSGAAENLVNGALDLLENENVLELAISMFPAFEEDLNTLRTVKQTVVDFESGQRFEVKDFIDDLSGLRLHSDIPVTIELQGKAHDLVTITVRVMGIPVKVYEDVGLSQQNTGGIELDIPGTDGVTLIREGAGIRVGLQGMQIGSISPDETERVHDAAPYELTDAIGLGKLEETPGVEEDLEINQVPEVYVFGGSVSDNVVLVDLTQTMYTDLLRDIVREDQGMIDSQARHILRRSELYWRDTDVSIDSILNYLRLHSDDYVVLQELIGINETGPNSEVREVAGDILTGLADALRWFGLDKAGNTVEAVTNDIDDFALWLWKFMKKIKENNAYDIEPLLVKGIMQYFHFNIGARMQSLEDDSTLFGPTLSAELSLPFERRNVYARISAYIPFDMIHLLDDPWESADVWSSLDIGMTSTAKISNDLRIGAWIGIDSGIWEGPFAFRLGQEWDFGDAGRIVTAAQVGAGGLPTYVFFQYNVLFDENQIFE